MGVSLNSYGICFDVSVMLFFSPNKDTSYSPDSPEPPHLEAILNDGGKLFKTNCL